MTHAGDLAVNHAHSCRCSDNTKVSTRRPQQADSNFDTSLQLWASATVLRRKNGEPWLSDASFSSTTNGIESFIVAKS